MKSSGKFIIESRAVIKNLLVLTLLLVLIWPVVGCSEKDEPPRLDTIDKQFSYVMGYEAVGVLDGIETAGLDGKAFIYGIQDALEERTPRFSREQAMGIKSLVFERERNFKNQQAIILSGENRKFQQAFLEENKTREGVITTDSGLQYMILKEGDGPRPAPSDHVELHMIGSLPDGTVFDSTYADGSSVIGPVKGDLPVWEEALTLMRTGGRYRFFVPSGLGYGQQGTFFQGGIIGPEQMIILELELLDIVDPPAGDGVTDFLQGRR